jgi:hypothetical protein
MMAAVTSGAMAEFSDALEAVLRNATCAITRWEIEVASQSPRFLKPLINSV